MPKLSKNKSRLSRKHSERKHGKKHGKKSHKSHRSRSSRSFKHRYSGMLGDDCGLLNSVKDSDVKAYRNSYDWGFGISSLPCYNSRGDYIPTENHFSPDGWAGIVRSNMNDRNTRASLGYGNWDY